MLCKTFFAWYNFYIADSLECILFEQAHRLPQLNVHGIRKRLFFYHLKKRYPNTAATVFFHPEHFVTFEVSISSKPCSFFSVSYFSESCSMNLSSGECSTTSVLPVNVLAFIANLRFTWGFDLQRHLGFRSTASASLLHHWVFIEVFITLNLPLPLGLTFTLVTILALVVLAI